jgi:hypothetical protein
VPSLTRPGSFRKGIDLLSSSNDQIAKKVATMEKQLAEVEGMAPQ